MADALVVEDDPAVALVVRAVLSREGWTVRAASGAEEALACEGGFDLLLCDLNLAGGTNGAALAKAMRARDPALAVVLMSGDYEAARVTEEGFVLLPKPFLKAPLLEAIARARMTGS